MKFSLSEGRRGAADMNLWRPPAPSTTTTAVARGHLYRPAGPAGSRLDLAKHRVVQGGQYVGFRHPAAGREVSRAARDNAARKARVQEDLARRLDLKMRRFRLMHPMYMRKRKEAVKEAPMETCLEEITDRPLDQPPSLSDYFPHKPPSVQFVPAYATSEASTQVEPCDLYEFDVEVQPMLEALAGLSVKQAMDEVTWCEEALRESDRRKDIYQRRARELAEAQRLAEHERRLKEEGWRREEQMPSVLEGLEEDKKEVAKARVVRGSLDGLLPSALRGARDQEISGNDQDGVQHFSLWLQEQVQARVDDHGVARVVLQDTVHGVLRHQRRAFFPTTDKGTETTSPPPRHGE